MTTHVFPPVPLIVPEPNKMVLNEGEIRLSPASRIIAFDGDLKGKAELLANQLRRATGFPFDIIESSETSKSCSDIELVLDSGVPGLGPEGYRITTCDHLPLTICASTACGIGFGSRPCFNSCLRRFLTADRATMILPG